MEQLPVQEKSTRRVTNDSDNQSALQTRQTPAFSLRAVTDDGDFLKEREIA